MFSDRCHPTIQERRLQVSEGMDQAPRRCYHKSKREIDRHEHLIKCRYPDHPKGGRGGNHCEERPNNDSDPQPSTSRDPPKSRKRPTDQSSTAPRPKKQRKESQALAKNSSPHKPALRKTQMTRNPSLRERLVSLYSEWSKQIKSQSN